LPHYYAIASLSLSYAAIRHMLIADRLRIIRQPLMIFIIAASLFSADIDIAITPTIRRRHSRRQLRFLLLPLRIRCHFIFTILLRRHI